MGGGSASAPAPNNSEQEAQLKSGAVSSCAINFTAPSSSGHVKKLGSTSAPTPPAAACNSNTDQANSAEPWSCMDQPKYVSFSDHCSREPTGALQTQANLLDTSPGRLFNEAQRRRISQLQLWVICPPAPRAQPGGATCAGAMNSNSNSN